MVTSRTSARPKHSMASRLINLAPDATKQRLNEPLP